jgi:hypothetical protein
VQADIQVRRPPVSGDGELHETVPRGDLALDDPPRGAECMPADAAAVFRAAAPIMR